MPDALQYFDVDGRPIAVLHREGASPGLVWLGGFRSEMRGTKAEALDAFAREHGKAFVRHDYSGHGLSGGVFAEGTISRWLAESLAVFRRFTSGRQILVGSSMGAWIALRMVTELRKEGEDRVGGLVLLAPAPDFTADLIEPSLTRKQRRELATKGFFAEKSAYAAEPDIFTNALIEDGRANRVMTGTIDTGCPVHILQGLADPDVPYSHAMKLVEHLPADDVTLTLIPGGDHRLSRPEDLQMLRRAVSDMILQVG